MGHITSLEKTGTRWQDKDHNPSTATEITLDTKSVSSSFHNPSKFAVSPTFGLVDKLDQSHQKDSSATNRNKYFLFCDASMTGYRFHLDQQTLSWQWSEVQKTLYINFLELQTVWKGLIHYPTQTTMVVVYRKLYSEQSNNSSGYCLVTYQDIWMI